MAGDPIPAAPSGTSSGSSSGGVMVSSELLIPLVLCLLLLALATAAHRVLKRDEAHRLHAHLRAVRIAQCVLSWYLVSISFTLWNKFVLRYWRGGGFPFPVFVTLTHMTTKLCITRLLNARCLVRADRKITALPCGEAIRGPVPIGVCTAMDVALSNLSFLFISVAFYTILKASAVLWSVRDPHPPAPGAACAPPPLRHTTHHTLTNQPPTDRQDPGLGVPPRAREPDLGGPDHLRPRRHGRRPRQLRRGGLQLGRLLPRHRGVRALGPALGPDADDAGGEGRHWRRAAAWAGPRAALHLGLGLGR